MGATRPHSPAARGELLGATAPWQNRSRTKKNKPTLNTKLRILPPPYHAILRQRGQHAQTRSPFRRGAYPSLASSRAAQGPCSPPALRMAKSRGTQGVPKSSLPSWSWALSHPARLQERAAALSVLQRPPRPDCKDRAPTRPATVPGHPQGRRMKPIPRTKTLCSRLPPAEQNPLCPNLSKNNQLLLELPACRPTPFSDCHSLPARFSAASASDHRGACRASNRSRSTLSPPPSRLNKRAESFPLKSHGAGNSTAGLFNNQFHSGLRRNETSGLDRVELLPTLPNLRTNLVVVLL